MKIISKDIALKILNLRKSGKSFSKISKELGVTTATAYKYSNFSEEEINNIYSDVKKFTNNDIIAYYKKSKSLKKTSEKFDIYPKKIKSILKKNNVELYKPITQYDLAVKNSEAIIAMYKKGFTIKDVSKKFDINQSTLSKFLKDNNIDIVHFDCINVSEDIQNEIVNKYKNHISGINIAKQYDINSNTVYKILKNHNVQIRNDREKSLLYELDENYFEKIDSEHKAYWLGFIYADGYITAKRQYSNPKFGITLSSNDRLHLVKLSLDLKSNYPINDYCNNTSYKKDTKSSRLLISNNKIVEDLKKHGVCENKTNILTAPDIPENLIPHFIRGYLDGDGCITSYKAGGYLRYKVSILGTENILNFISDFISCNLDFEIKDYYKRKENQTVSSLDICSCIRSKKFLDLIYKNSSIYLDRKYNRYLELCEFMNSRAYRER